MKNKSILILLLCLFSIVFCKAQTTDKEVKISSIPYEISWVNQAKSWSANGNTLVLEGGKGSRLFTDPQQKTAVDTAPIALFEPDETFLLYCELEVGFNTIFDAGVLMIYANSDQWAKFCFEYSPQFKPMIVSVVNNQYSDDSNHDIIDGNKVHLRITGLGGGAYAFHYSLDGEYWNMVRYFYLNPTNDLKIGFLSQSPRGDSCETTFHNIKYTVEKLDDLRGGK